METEMGASWIRYPSGMVSITGRRVISSVEDSAKASALPSCGWAVTCPSRVVPDHTSKVPVRGSVIHWPSDVARSPLKDTDRVVWAAMDTGSMVHSSTMTRVHSIPFRMRVTCIRPLPPCSSGRAPVFIVFPA